MSVYYYTDGINYDLIYELPMYAYRGMKMSTETFNKMFGRPTLGRPCAITLERMDEEDIMAMKRYTSFNEGLVKIPYPNVLSNIIQFGDSGVDEDGYVCID